MKRILDFLVSLIGIVFLLPFMLIIAVWIKLDSYGPIFYKQLRVGKDNKDFYLYKFRTMRVDAENKGYITIGNRDSRITNSGYYLRKIKLDEVPQLINVLIGNMSLVGPRPEVRKYVSMYNSEQIKVLSVKPGITDNASILYSNENEILAQQTNPEDYYIKVIMPDKLRINLEYIKNTGVRTDINIIIKTLIKVFKGNPDMHSS